MRSLRRQAPVRLLSIISNGIRSAQASRERRQSSGSGTPKSTALKRASGRPVGQGPADQAEQRRHPGSISQESERMIDGHCERRPERQDPERRQPGRRPGAGHSSAIRRRQTCCPWRIPGARTRPAPADRICACHRKPMWRPRSQSRPPAPARHPSAGARHAGHPRKLIADDICRSGKPGALHDAHRPGRNWSRRLPGRASSRCASLIAALDEAAFAVAKVELPHSHETLVVALRPDLIESGHEALAPVPQCRGVAWAEVLEVEQSKLARSPS